MPTPRHFPALAPDLAGAGSVEPRPTLRSRFNTATSWGVAALLTLGIWQLPLAHGAAPTIGLPTTRTYSIEEIGVSRGPRLGFDQYGRLAVISGDNLAVLNDATWINLAEESETVPPIAVLAHDSDGVSYFGALAAWGIADYTAEGQIRARSLRPKPYPAWINSITFTEILLTDGGVIFSGTNGLVFLDTATGEQIFHEVSIASVFALGSQIYISSNSLGTFAFDPRTGEKEFVDRQISMHEVVTLSDGRLIGATTGSRLLFFDGQRFEEFDPGFRERRVGGISRLKELPDGGFALAVDGEGLFVFSNSGESKMALTTTSYRRIFDLASNEPGILWLAEERSVQKVLYNDPVSVIDQRSDVVVGWPQAVQWRDRTVIVSHGRLYEMVLEEPGWRHRFVEIHDIPTAGAWSVAANDHHLLIGNGDGAFVRGDAGFEQIAGVSEANRLHLVEDDLCLVIGNREIAAIRWDGSSWVKAAPEAPAFGFPSVAHRAGNSMWIELGLDRAARIWFEDGVIKTQLYDEFPWDEPVWVNVGVLNNYIVFCGTNDQRLYLDRETGMIVEPSPIEIAIQKAPQTILRLVEDHQGVIWASHPHGVLTFRPDGDGYRIDSDSLASLRDHYPVIILSDEQHAWISTESALYHVRQDHQPSPSHALQPFLVSISNGSTGEELHSKARPSETLTQIPYSSNHLIFRYFAGGYGKIENPLYEYSMQNRSSNWKIVSADSLLTLPSLEEGNYRLTAQLRDGEKPVGKPVVTAFTIHPPWYRSALAYMVYWGTGILLSVGAAAWAARRAKRKHDYLEQLVRERTDELRATMDRLTEEARISATLAERNRLAGEIHDSLQQGLSGLALQLDATLKLGKLDADLQSRISVARRMVSYTRQEVQQAVWDLESPLLQSNDLPEALSNLAELLSAGSTEVQVESTGPAIELPPAAKHHLLRIAQEAITNAVRHSGATTIRARLTTTEETVTLEVADDGHGFDTRHVFSEGVGHFGLRGMKTRVSRISGQLLVHSSIGHGTTIRVVAPQSNTSNIHADRATELREN